MCEIVEQSFVIERRVPHQIEHVNSRVLFKTLDSGVVIVPVSRAKPLFKHWIVWESQQQNVDSFIDEFIDDKFQRMLVFVERSFRLMVRCCQVSIEFCAIELC
ncbi:MAG: hypothetical protein DWC11_01715 [Candidatus Poseidoniales archaeon]|nr:MAG: hypothetical protein DWC11_01715 [Candidatus Poseidoniales archaeon]